MCLCVSVSLLTFGNCVILEMGHVFLRIQEPRVVVLSTLFKEQVLVTANWMEVTCMSDTVTNGAAWLHHPD